MQMTSDDLSSSEELESSSSLSEELSDFKMYENIF